MLQAEGLLLKGYGQTMTNDHARAARTLSEAASKIESAAMPSRDSIDMEQSAFQRNREQYDSLAQSAGMLAATPRSEYAAAQIDSLGGRLEELRKSLQQHYLFRDELGRTKLFSTGLDKLREDIEYALARANKMAASQGLLDAQKKVQQTQQELDGKIQ